MCVCVPTANAPAALASGLLSMGLAIPPLFDMLVASETDPGLLPVSGPPISNWEGEQRSVCAFVEP